MNIKILGIFAVLLSMGFTAFSQSNDQNRIVYPTQEQIDKYNRLVELLKHPTFITLRLASMRRDSPSEEPSTTPSPYTIDQAVSFQLFITQNSTESLVLTSSSGSFYRQYRLNLVRDGDVIPYSREAQHLIEIAERDSLSGSARSKTLEPGREHSLGLFQVDSWYDSPLKPGHYQLTVRKRFTLDGDWVESNPVTFDVVPRKPTTPIPNGFIVRLVPERPKEQPQGQTYRLGYNDGVAVDLVNDSDQRVPVSVVDKYYGHRPQLTKDGKVIPYSDEVAKLIESKEKDTRLVEVVNVFFLDPKTKSRLDGFSLKQWYGPLAPGTYHLTYRRRFEIGGPWTKDSAEFVFEIVPQG
ncbi:MAG TPA: hypothetical protein VF397_10125 [Pyrinomonadaceae bacterium]